MTESPIGDIFDERAPANVFARAFEELKRRGKLDSVWRDSDTPLTYCIRKRRLDLAQALLSMGADPDACNAHGQCPLMWACISPDNADIAKVLIEAGADVEQANQVNDRPLHIATFSRSYAAMRMLLASGAQASAPGQDRKSPLHICSQKHDPEALEILAAAGANFKAKCAKRKTPLDWALDWSFLSPGGDYLRAFCAIEKALEEQALLKKAARRPRKKKSGRNPGL